MMVRVLIIEDESEIRRYLRKPLESAGYEVFDVATLQAGLLEAATKKPDLVLLDLGLPDGDGKDLMRELSLLSSAPIIVISGRIDDANKVSALDLGADDYLVKPPSIQELLARVRAALRRTHTTAASQNDLARFGEIEFDRKERVVRRRGSRVHITQVEYELLSLLVGHEGHLFTHRQLLRVIWGPTAVDHIHYLRIYMRQLRRKLEVDPARPVHFLTEIGVGYRFVSDARLHAGQENTVPGP